MIEEPDWHEPQNHSFGVPEPEVLMKDDQQRHQNPDNVFHRFVQVGHIRRSELCPLNRLLLPQLSSRFRFGIHEFSDRQFNGRPVAKVAGKDQIVKQFQPTSTHRNDGM